MAEACFRTFEYFIETLSSRPTGASGTKTARQGALKIKEMQELE